MTGMFTWQWPIPADVDSTPAAMHRLLGDAARELDTLTGGTVPLGDVTWRIRDGHLVAEVGTREVT